MSDKYAATAVQDVTTATPGDTALSIQSLTTVRPELYDLVWSHGAAPADTVIQWLVRRFDTADGTATGVTPGPLDPGAPASGLTVLEDHSVEPTDAGVVPLYDMDLNQRATFRWVAAPGGEIKFSAVATEGIYITPVSTTYALAASVTAHWIE
jgi:hypothetical protein